MNPVIKSQTRSLQDEHGLLGLSPSEAFEAYTIYAVLAGQLGYPVNAIDAHLKGDEFGLDGVAILIEGKLAQDTDDAAALLSDVFDPDIDFIFFQSKTGNSYDYGDIGKTFDGIEQFISGELAGESDQLDDLIAVKDLIYEQAVSKRNPGIRVYYATTGNYEQPDKIENLLERRMRTLRGLSIFDTGRMHLEMLGAEKLQSFYRSAKRSSKAKIEFPRQTALPKNYKVEQGYVGYIAASEIVKMVQVVNEAEEIIGINRYVFFDNVRDYNEKSPLNQKISSTIKSDEGADFVFRNNGVTVIAAIIDLFGPKRCAI
jgi:AIPR protein